MAAGVDVDVDVVCSLQSANRLLRKAKRSWTDLLQNAGQLDQGSVLQQLLSYSEGASALLAAARQEGFEILCQNI